MRLLAGGELHQVIQLPVADSGDARNCVERRGHRIGRAVHAQPQPFRPAHHGGQPVDAVLGDDPALMDDDHALAHHAHLGQDVAGQENGAVLAQLPDQLARLRHLDRVDADGRLIENQHFRIVDDRLRQSDALPKTLGQFGQKDVVVLLERTLLDHVVDAAAHRVPFHAA